MDELIDIYDIGINEYTRIETSVSYDSAPYIEPKPSRLNNIYTLSRDILQDNSEYNNQWNELLSALIFCKDYPHALEVLTGRFLFIKGSEQILTAAIPMKEIYSLAQIFRNKSTVLTNLSAKLASLFYINKITDEGVIPQTSRNFYLRYESKFYLTGNDIIKKLITTDVEYIFKIVEKKMSGMELDLDFKILRGITRKLTFINNIDTFRMIYKPERQEYIYQVKCDLDDTSIVINNDKRINTPRYNLTSYLLLLIGKILDV